MKEDGGPAFPLQWWDHTSTGDLGLRETYMGMTLRDWFAGQVLAGIMPGRPLRFDPKHDAEYCYAVADAMIKERGNG